jgi:hypothetical protein
MFNKRGAGADEWLDQIPYIILTIIVLVGIVILINYYTAISVNVKPLQAHVLFNRIMYSPNSIMYTDNVTGQVYPGVIDWDNFTNETLDKAINYSYERQLAARLELHNNESKVIKTAYLNHVWFNRLEPLISNSIQGAGKGYYYQDVPVIYRKNSVNLPGFLDVYILLPD